MVQGFCLGGGSVEELTGLGRILEGPGPSPGQDDDGGLSCAMRCCGCATGGVGKSSLRRTGRSLSMSAGGANRTSSSRRGRWGSAPGWRAGFS